MHSSESFTILCRSELTSRGLPKYQGLARFASALATWVRSPCFSHSLSRQTSCWGGSAATSPCARHHEPFALCLVLPTPTLICKFSVSGEANSSLSVDALQRNPRATKEQFQQACMDAQLDFVDDLLEKYSTFVGAGALQRKLGTCTEDNVTKS